MKIRNLAALLAAVLLTASFVSCENEAWKDDFDSMQAELNSVKQELANQKKLIEALQENATISSIKTENGRYVINFSNGQSITFPDTPLITIGENGNWFIDGNDTGVRAKGEKGEDGRTPVIEIGENGHWIIDGKDTGVSAQGAGGKEGLYITSIVDKEETTDFVFSDGTVTTVAKTDGGVIRVKGTWCSLGTSITWYNDNVGVAHGRFSKGYQDRVCEKLKFDGFINNGRNGSTVINLASNLSPVVKADYYTIEHGINDWGHSTKVGELEDLNTGRNTFYGAYGKVIRKIYELNPKAKIILCTPRKAYGFRDFLPPHWYDPLNGIYLEEYADAVEEIAEYMSLPVADFFEEGQANQENLPALSIDEALHPNDEGYQIMANLLITQFKKIIDVKE